LVENSENELIDYDATCQKMKHALEDPYQAGLILKKYRPELIGWLNSVFFSMDQIHPNSCSMNLKWWWEMGHRIRKAITVSVVLEKYNLLGLGGKPQVNDIPQCLVELWDLLDYLDLVDAYKTIRYQHQHMVQKHKNQIFKFYLQ
jgi:hypothetical protein